MKFKDFLKKAKKPLIFLLVCLVAIFTMMGIADGIQKDWGNIDVSMGSFEITDEIDDESVYSNSALDYLYDFSYDPALGVTVTYKLYKPNSEMPEGGYPAVLLLHGYQNDHETCDAYCIELARRGYVVLAIDEFGHGKTNTGIKDRGYVCHKVTVCYGYDSEETKTYKEIGNGGADRYKVMMNFSNLTFFNKKYSSDEKNDLAIKDSSMGGIAAYGWLSQQEFVNSHKMAVSGHSMGTWASWSVSAAYSRTDIEPKATVLQCGEVFSEDAYNDYKLLGINLFHFNNVLILQAKWDEFNYFRDYDKAAVTEEVMLAEGTPRYNFLKEGGLIDQEYHFNTTYGLIGLGTARRVEFLYTNHRLTTHDENGLKAAIDWINQSVNSTVLGIINEEAYANQVTNFTYHAKEWLTFASLLVGIVSMFALFAALIKLPFFSKVIEPVVNKNSDGTYKLYRPNKLKTNKRWWRGALITMGISAVTYPFMTQLGHGLLPLPENIFRMTIGNGFLAWYLLLIIIMLCTTIIPFRKRKGTKDAIDYVDLGFSREALKNKFDWLLLLKMFILVVSMVLLMYVEVVLCEQIFMLDFRMIWPFFKSFNWTRFGQFLVYFPIFALFFVLNNSKIFAQGRCKDMDKPGFLGFMNSWWRSALCMVGGILIIILLEYIPFFIGWGPGADLLFGTTFGGPFMSLLIVFAPQVLVFSFMCTYAYRKTGNVYVGALTVAALACWIVTGGSAIF